MTFDNSLIRLLDDSRLMEPFEHSTSSENDTREFARDCLLEDEVEDDDTDGWNP